MLQRAWQKGKKKTTTEMGEYFDIRYKAALGGRLDTESEGQAEYRGRSGCFGDSHSNARAAPDKGGNRGAVSNKAKGKKQLRKGHSGALFFVQQAFVKH